MRFNRITALLSLAAAAIVALTSCSGSSKQQATAQPNAGKVLVCYFSASGHTRGVAIRIANQCAADLYEITPAQAYTNGDLDWTDSLSRSSVEMKDPASRPELGGKPIDFSKYSTIYLGYPNWWNTAPHIINSFVDANRKALAGHPIVTFMTSGGGDIDNSEHDLQTAYPELQWKEGRLLNDVTDEELIKWVGATH